MEHLHTRGLFGFQAIGDIKEGNGFGFRVIGRVLQSPMAFGFPAIGNREGEAGFGFPDTGSIVESSSCVWSRES